MPITRIEHPQKTSICNNRQSLAGNCRFAVPPMVHQKDFPWLGLNPTQWMSAVATGSIQQTQCRRLATQCAKNIATQ